MNFFETEFLLNKEPVFTKLPWRYSCSCSHSKKLRMSIIYSETHNQPLGTFLSQNHNFKYFGGSYQTNYWKPIYLHFSNYQYRYETYWNYRWFEGIVCKNIDIEKKITGKWSKNYRYGEKNYFLVTPNILDNFWWEA